MKKKELNKLYELLEEFERFRNRDNIEEDYNLGRKIVGIQLEIMDELEIFKDK